MVRLFGRSKKLKKRATPVSPEQLRDQFPLYQYALNEYAQTVIPQSSNDDGQQPPSGLPSSRSMSEPVMMMMSSHSSPGAMAETTSSISVPSAAPMPTASSIDSGTSPSDNASLPPPTAKAVTSPYLPMGQPREYQAPGPFVFYQENYGAAYTGGPLRYIYPNGYQSMRPRSCPWKLSIVVCLLFTWLSVFIVDHCSIQQKNEDEIDVDDDLVIAIQMQWCGSRPLYLMWVCSMWITGLSAAYCGVIGYIKVRDFSVANARSQPPGILPHKSDYHIYYSNNNQNSNNHNNNAAGNNNNNTSGSSTASVSNLYQADGTPQFWGMHISRPTQAAVAVTSR